MSLCSDLRATGPQEGRLSRSFPLSILLALPTHSGQRLPAYIHSSLRKSLILLPPRGLSSLVTKKAFLTTPPHTHTLTHTSPVFSLLIAPPEEFTQPVSSVCPAAMLET